MRETKIGLWSWKNTKLLEHPSIEFILKCGYSLSKQPCHLRVQIRQGTLWNMSSHIIIPNPRNWVREKLRDLFSAVWNEQDKCPLRCISSAFLWLLLKGSSHTTYLSMFKVVFSTSFSFFFCKLCTSLHILIPAAAAGSALQDSSSWQERQKWTDLNELFASLVHQSSSPLPQPSPSHTSLPCTGERERPLYTQRGCVAPPIPKLPEVWKQTSIKTKVSFNANSWHDLREKRETSLRYFSGFQTLAQTIYRCLWLLLLSKY